MNKKARFNKVRTSMYIYSLFLGEYFTDEKIYEVLPEKLTEEDDYFVYFYFANSADYNVLGFIDVICEAYIRHNNNRPNDTLYESTEEVFNTCLNNYVGGKRMEGFEEFTLELNNFRSNLEESGYSIVTQSIRINLDYSKVK